MTMIELGHSMSCVHRDLGGGKNGWSYGGKARGESGSGRVNAPVTFINKVRKLVAIRNRLRGVYIENDDAFKVIKRWDKFENVLFYLDPPYPHSTRVDTNAYEYEMDDVQHERLIELVLSCKSKFVISSYPNSIYDRLLEHGFRKIEREVPVFASNARETNKRRRYAVEVLYIRDTSV